MRKGIDRGTDGKAKVGENIDLRITSQFKLDLYQLQTFIAVEVPV